MTLHDDGQHAWLRLGSGRRLDLLDPDPQAWTDEELATGLARTWRWGGQSCWPRPLSVAQHSRLVLAIREQQAQRTLPPAHALRELLADADAALIGSFACPASLQPHLGPGYARIVRGLKAAVAHRYGLPAWSAEDWALHERAERIATASEAVHELDIAPESVRRELGIDDVAPLADEPLLLPSVLRRDARPWAPWPPSLTARWFLGQLETLSELAEREARIAALAAAFTRLPAALRARCQHAVTGDPLLDELVRVDAPDGSGGFAGVVVAGQRNGDGGWALDGELLVFSTDGAPEGALFTVQGAICDVDVL